MTLGVRAWFKLTSPLAFALVRACSYIPLVRLRSMTSSPVAGLFCVPLVTVPVSTWPGADRAQVIRRKKARCFKLAPSSCCRFQFFNFGQNAGGFRFHAQAHAIVVGLGEFTGLEFKIQITQIFVHYFLAFVEIVDARFFSAPLGRPYSEVTYEDQCSGAKQPPH